MVVLNKMKRNDDRYISLNFLEGTLFYYHVDNIDFLEDMSEDSRTTHTLNCIAFQSRMSKSLHIIELDLPQHYTGTYLQPKHFGNLENCLKPSKKDFIENLTFERTWSMSLLAQMLCWAMGKAMEFLFSSLETKLKDETTRAFDPFLNALTHSSDKADRNNPPKNTQNTSVELDE